MNSWSEIITLPVPLRDACLHAPAPVHEPIDTSLQDQWQIGYNQGRIDGEKSLSTQLLEQRAEMNDLVHGALQSLRQAVPKVVRETENLVVSLALEVAQKLVSGLPVSVPMVEAAVRDALAQVDDSAQITVRLNPSDLELLQNAGSSLFDSAKSPNEFKFVGSSDVTRGGCLVQTRFGTVDARRETKLDLLKRNLVP